MTDQRSNIKSGECVFDDNNQEKNLGPVWDQLVLDI